MKTSVVKRNRIDQDVIYEHNPVALSDNTLKPEKTKDEPETAKKFSLNPGRALTITLAICTLAIITSCNTPAENVKEAKEDVTQANEDLDKAQQEYAADIEQFRVASEKKIAANEKAIADINREIKKSQNKIDSEYEKQIVVLEKKNKELKTKMTDYKADTKENWQLFKTEFNKDMDELGVALKNFTIDNK